MDPASVTAAFVFMAFAALSYIRTKSIVFCDSSTRNGDEAESPGSKPCVPCPGRCREGKLVACRRGYILTDQTCEPDVLFQNRVYLLKNSIEKDVRDRRLRSLSEVREGKRASRDEDKLFDIALEELLAENRLVVGAEGRLYLPGLESYPGRTVESSLESYTATGFANVAIICLLLLVSGILFIKGWSFNQRRRRRWQDSNPESMETIVFEEEPSSNPYVPSQDLGDEILEENGFYLIFEESSAFNVDDHHPPVPMEETTLPVMASERISSSSFSAPATTRDEGPSTSTQQPKPTTTIDCLLCSERVASEALLCGHLICCELCLDSYKENMARSNNLRCPYCRKHSNGTWLHIHGLTS